MSVSVSESALSSAIAKVEKHTRELAGSGRPTRSSNQSQPSVDPPVSQASDLEQAGALIAQLADASTKEVDRVISDLSSMRDLLAVEAERVQQEMSRYGSLCEAGMEAIKTIDGGMQDLKARISETKSRSEDV